VNLKIKPAQYFRVTPRGRMCVRVFIGVSAHMCMSIYVYTVFLKKIYRKSSVNKANALSQMTTIMYISHSTEP
jgi:hypothetical protein